MFKMYEKKDNSRGKKVIEVGRLCVKIAGRDAGKKCVIVDILDDNYVMIDGETRRKRCSIKHIEPLKETIKIKKKASHDVVVTAFKKLNIIIKPKKTKTKSERPRKVRKGKKKPVKEKKPSKKK